MPKYILIIILLVIGFLRVKASDNKTVSLIGATISDACHGYICHGPAKTAYKVLNSSDSLVVSDSSKNPSDGYFRITNLSKGQKYKFVVDDSAFLYREYLFEIPAGAEYDELSKDMLIVPAVTGVEVLFDVSPFYRGKSRIRQGIDYYLDEIFELILQNPDVRFELSCYPDDDENESENMALTLNRGVSLQNYLIEKGVKPRQITIQPNASSDPKLPPYDFKMAKGKRYIGSTYLVIKNID